ncbi:MAG: DUF882 domain-containing protein [Marinilabiliales bacterium]|nr:DUF882 domain-containing protein [Marinilabiliales bacterium]
MPPEALLPTGHLAFYNTHTAEFAAVEYCQSGSLVPASLETINRILRDTRTGEVKDIDLRPPRSSQRPRPDARDQRALPRHLRLPLGQHQRIPADIRQRRGGGQQHASRRQGHRHPRPGRPSPGPLPGGGRAARRRRGDLPRVGFRPRRRRPRPDLVGRPTGVSAAARSSKALPRAASLR